MRNFGLVVLAAPRNAVIAFLKVYRVVISPLYGDVCKFYPSCSSYGLQAVSRFGVIRGSAMTLRRLGRCHPWALGGVDDVPPYSDPRFRFTDHGFVVPNTTGRS